ncbi:RING-H2 finger protein ATL56-like [Ipomoea triloba]|uniref:RING-H2 finger protein ATL56-like n=1 Tax=Ipomoea triloba TaxID=35885 RepID=UPI00125DA85A|nr:RING-H2 finger protein ATL56-like [Ipomoea triloba]
MEVVVCLVLLFIGVGVFTFIHVCIVGRAFGSISSGESFNPRRDMNNRRSSSMSQEDIKKLPCFEYKLEEEEDDDEERVSGTICAVCLEKFKSGDTCRVLPKCKHCFHAQCIEPWLITAAVCPICRAATNTPPFTTTTSIGEESSNSNSNQIVIELT